MLTILLFLAQPAELPECDQERADEGIQQEMNICAAHEFVKADAALNTQWAITRSALKERDEQWDEDIDPDQANQPGHFETLLKAQFAWLDFRDAHCRSVGLIARGGSIEPLLVTSCKTALTNARTEQLRELAQTY